jgi:hypothetical protein
MEESHDWDEYQQIRESRNGSISRVYEVSMEDDTSDPDSEVAAAIIGSGVSISQLDNFDSTDLGNEEHPPELIDDGRTGGPGGYCQEWTLTSQSFNDSAIPLPINPEAVSSDSPFDDSSWPHWGCLESQPQVHQAKGDFDYRSSIPDDDFPSPPESPGPLDDCSDPPDDPRGASDDSSDPPDELSDPPSDA